MKWKQDEGKNFSIEGGIYSAVCCSIIDIGTQHTEWQGKDKSRRQCIIGFELPEETYLDENTGEEKRSHISNFYTQSLDPRATLRKHLKGWRGRDFTPEELEGFDPKNILGVPAMLTVELTDKGKNKIEAISKYKGEPRNLEGEARYFMLTDDEGNITFDGNFPEWMSEGIQKLIKQSDEWKILTGEMQKPIAGYTPPAEDPAPEVDDSDIPF